MRFSSLLFFIVFVSCNLIEAAESPSWYVKPKQNNSTNLYGVAEGANLEESTKSALVDAASRLMVSISSESNMIREENQNSYNEEMRQKISQNVEKINFTNFKVSRSDQMGSRFFTEVEIEREPFLNEQKDRLSFLERQVADLEKNMVGKNLISKRNSLIKALDLQKQVELVARILKGAGENVNVQEKLDKLASLQNQFNGMTDKVEFYFEINSPKEITKIIRSGLNKEKIKISPKLDNSNQNQIVISVTSEKTAQKIYQAYITKLQIDFENLALGKVVASNKVEVTGSSAISEQESYQAALKALEDKISENGILKIIGIID